MQRYLKFFCSLVLITLLGTACQKEALIMPAQPVSAASISSKSGGSFRSSSPSQRRGSTSSESSISSEASTASSNGGVNIQQSSSTRFQIRGSSFKKINQEELLISDSRGNVKGYTTNGVSRADKHGTFNSYTMTRVEITSNGATTNKPHQHFRGAATNNTQHPH